MILKENMVKCSKASMPNIQHIVQTYVLPMQELHATGNHNTEVAHVELQILVISLLFYPIPKTAFVAEVIQKNWTWKLKWSKSVK